MAFLSVPVVRRTSLSVISQLPIRTRATQSFTSVRLRNPLLFRNPRRFRISCEAPSSPPAKPETVKKVIEIVTKQLATAPGTVQPHSKFQELGADSLDQVEIVMALEEEFKISVDEDGAEAIVTVQDAADLIENVLAKS